VVENGAIYWITSEALKRGEDWYSGVFYGYKMPKERSLDIDHEQDLLIARHLVSNGLPK
jgi:CMP-N-acetylneuraminic acid synthetase